ncbi:MAG TPA: site-specific DNA-methyltransferase [Acidimicrobiales bacterium]|nr:site-specific DNA-methyltransferase [Acidimicrobiales bacterium]
MSLAPVEGGGRRRGPTTTARFGSGRRESHDASAFYERFTPPTLSADATVVRPAVVDVLRCADARSMGDVESNSVALVVTSPPYFAGKEYEAVLGAGGSPASWFEYLGLLRDVFAECARVLEPGGRIAVNVANLGRRPFRSLAGDVAAILEDIGLLLRGEVVWWKGRAAGGSCTWGSFQSPANPVLRDVTERVVIAGKGRFDRALTPAQRAARGLPSVATVTREEFLEATTDLWELPPERATRVGHPAPFPVELPQRLIELYTYRGDVVLDPFAGSGSTAVAAVRTGRHYLGYDTDAAYLARAEERVAEERARQAPAAPGAGPVAAALAEGRSARDVAEALLGECGFTDVRTGVRLPRLGMELNLVGRTRSGTELAFEVAGGFTTGGSGLRKADTVWRAIAKAAVVHQGAGMQLVLLTTDRPLPGSPTDRALAAVSGPGRPVAAVLGLLDPDGRERLRALAG